MAEILLLELYLLIQDCCRGYVLLFRSFLTYYRPSWFRHQFKVFVVF
jgi:hypothetical protein